MVKILANGEIVSDDYQVNKDPQRHKNSNIGRIINSDYSENGEIQQRSSFLPIANIIEFINQRLNAYGAPTFFLGPFQFKPIVSLGFLLATLIWGYNGAIFSALLYLIVYFSQTAAPNIPIIRNLMERIGLADRQSKQGITNSQANFADSNESNSLKTTVSTKKPFSGTGYKLSD